MNIPTEATLKGATLALENAKNLLEVANAAEQLGHFGQGSSLCVLAAEEGMKALVLRTVQTGLVLDGGLDELFANHIVKHQLAFLFSFFAYWGIIANQTRTSTQKDIDDGKITDKEAGGVWMMRMYEEIKKIEHPDRSEEFAFITWFRDANAFKKKGFYVDWGKEDWSTPADIQSNVFKRYKEAASRWLNLVEVFHSISDEDFKTAIELGNQAMEKSKKK